MTGDDISAASLLMAVVAILYGAWYQEISCAAQVAVPQHDKHNALAQVEPAFFARCLPLACMAAMVVLVFLPTTVGIVGHSITVLEQHGAQAYTQYNSARTAFCLVVGVGLAITGHLWRMTWRLACLRRRLKA